MRDISPVYLPRIRAAIELGEYAYPYEYYAAGPSVEVIDNGVHRCVQCGDADDATCTYCENCGSINCRSHTGTERLEGDPVCTGCAVTERFFCRLGSCNRSEPVDRPARSERFLPTDRGEWGMKGVVIAAGEGTRLRPLTEDKPKGMVEVAGKPILTHCFDQLVDLGAETLLTVVGYKKEQIIEYYGDEFAGVPITYTHQREPLGIAHALLTAEEHIDDDFMLMLGDNIFRANLDDVISRQEEDRADAAFLVEEVPHDEADRYGVCDTNKYGEIVEVIEKPDDPPTNLVMTGFYTFTPAIFHACHLVQPSDRDEYELSDAIDLLIQSGRTIDAIRMDGWRVDVGYPEDRDEAERRLREAGEVPEDDDAVTAGGAGTQDADTGK